MNHKANWGLCHLLNPASGQSMWEVHSPVDYLGGWSDCLIVVGELLIQEYFLFKNNVNKHIRYIIKVIVSQWWDSFKSI